MAFGPSIVALSQYTGSLLASLERPCSGPGFMRKGGRRKMLDNASAIAEKTATMKMMPATAGLPLAYHPARGDSTTVAKGRSERSLLGIASEKGLRVGFDPSIVTATTSAVDVMLEGTTRCPVEETIVIKITSSFFANLVFDHLHRKHVKMEASNKTIAETILGDRTTGDQPDFRDLPGGGILWKASLVLLNYIEKKALDTIRGKKVLELGSGAGHLALALYRLGAHVACTERDQMGALERLRRNVENAKVTASPDCGSVIAYELEWGAQSKSELYQQPLDYDVIIMSELIYEPDSHDLLVETLQKICTRKTLIYSIFCDRPFSFMFFVKLHDAGGFAVEAVPDGEIDLLGMQPEANVCMHKIRLADVS